MLGWTDGKFCGERCGGCEMVQLGAYMAEPTADEEVRSRFPSFFLPRDTDKWVPFFERECKASKCRLNLVTCINLASPRLEWALCAGESFFKAGGDLLELNVHGNYKRYLDRGLLRNMVRPENRKELFRWVDTLCRLDIPLIVKLNGQHDREFVLQAVSELEEYPIFGIHMNIRSLREKKPDLSFIHDIREVYHKFLLTSGYIYNSADAKEVFDAGADMVGIAEPVLEDGAFISSLVSHYENSYVV